MFRILDWYIIRRFLGTFFFIMLMLMLIAVIFDVSEKVDDFLDGDVIPTLGEVLFDYYLNFIAHYGNLFSFLIIFIAVIYFTSKMSGDTEIVAIISSGISFNRLLRPFFMGATIIAGLSLLLNHMVLPKANETRLEFEERFIRNPFNITAENMHREVNEGEIVYFKIYLSSRSEARNFSVENWDKENHRLEWKLTAATANYNDTTKVWKLKSWFIREYGEERDVLRHGAEMDTIFNFSPMDFAQRLNAASAMSYTELNEYIERERDKGSDKIAFFEIEKHQRTSYPLATYVLTLIGVCIASRKARGGIGVHLALGIALAMVYIFCMKITTVAATNAGLDPFIAVWIPNLVFLGIGLMLYRFAQK